MDKPSNSRKRTGSVEEAQRRLNGLTIDPVPPYLKRAKGPYQFKDKDIFLQTLAPPVSVAAPPMEVELDFGVGLKTEEETVIYEPSCLAEAYRLVEENAKILRLYGEHINKLSTATVDYQLNRARTIMFAPSLEQRAADEEDFARFDKIHTITDREFKRSIQAYGSSPNASLLTLTAGSILDEFEDDGLEDRELRILNSIYQEQEDLIDELTTISFESQPELHNSYPLLFDQPVYEHIPLA